MAMVGTDLLVASTKAVVGSMTTEHGWVYGGGKHNDDGFLLVVVQRRQGWARGGS
uniref:Uncharacterized protein n=1 Tax=Cucumis melo TaxID=3656 RepID=A0A9I9E357_CUCME